MPEPYQVLVGPLVIAALAAAAFLIRRSAAFGGYSFTLFVFTFVAASLFYPWAFSTWFGFPLSRLVLPLIQIIMFGMGISLSVSDFVRAVRMPRAVIVGIVLQFAVMPITGFVLASAFGFEGAVAAGVVLIGSCPGGVASNVITYLARGNVALSVTMTACSTMMAPLMTPLMMKLLAGAYVPISFEEMMISIFQMIIVPVIAGLVANKLIHGRAPWIDDLMPVVSMAGICLIIAIITAASRDKLLQVGLALIAAAILHNTVGYVLGYWGARAAGLNETDSRTVSIEVGLQNGGMASGLAINVLHSTDAGLAPAIFGPWMNISGSTLASWWRKRLPANETSPHAAGKTA